MKFKIAAVQPDLNKPNSEIKKSMKRFIAMAKAKGADIVCFPECSLFEGPKKNEVFLREIMAECRINDIWCIVVGNLREGGDVYNTAVIIDSNGEIAGKHRKVHICDPYHVRPGTSFEVFDTPFSKIGLAICWDINHPEALNILARKGANVIFCPMYWHYELWSHSKNHLDYEKRILESLVLARAYENLVYVVFCNPYNSVQPTLTSYTAIAEPHKVVNRVFKKEGMIVAEVDLKYLAMIRKRYRKEYNKVVSS